MNEKLEPKIKCRYCSEVFVLFEDLQGHRCRTSPGMFPGNHESRLRKWLDESDKKVESFETMLEESLDT